MRGRSVLSLNRGKRGKRAGTGLLFQSDLNSSGVSNLSQDITINGVTVSPSFRYEAKDTDGTTWTAVVGENLSASGTPTVGLPAPFTDSTELVRHTNASSSHSSADDFVGMTTEDFILEVVMESGALIKQKNSNNSVFPGWMIGYSGAGDGSIYCYIADGTNNASFYSSAPHGTLVHVVVAFRVGEGGRIYANGVTGATSGVALTGAPSSSNPVVIGSDSGTAGIYYAALWKGQDWLDARDQDSWVAERFQKLTGIFPQLAKGTKTPTYTRATSAFLDKRDSGGVTRLFRVPSGWPRIATRADTSSDLVSGFLVEKQSTNLMLQSQDLSTTWTVGNAGVNSNVAEAPDGTTTADGIWVSAVSATHYIRQDVTITATSYSLSCWAKSGAHNWFQLQNVTTSSTASFDLVNGTVGTVTNGTAGIQDYGNGWYRCWLTFTGTAASHQLRLVPAEADGDGSYLGDGSTTETYVWGVQLETIGSTAEGPTSYVATTTASATRNADTLTYDADGNVFASAGTMDVRIMYPWANTADYRMALNVDNGTTNERHAISIEPNEKGRSAGGDNGGTAWGIDGSSDITDGDSHRLTETYDASSVELYVDGVQEGQDTSVTLPSGFTVIRVGHYNGGLYHSDGLIHSVKMYNRKVAPGA